MKSISLSIFLIVLSVISIAQELKFNSDRIFKIAQFTDVHYIAGKEASKRSLQMIESTLDAEKPQLVVFTGDVVVENPIQQGWDEILAPVISRNIPYLVMLGNHDDEGEWNRKAIAEYVVKKKLILNKQSIVPQVDGVLNQSVSIKGANGQIASVIYAMDSHAYSKVPRVRGYGWFATNQVAWFKQEEAKYKALQKDTIPSLAFFHIPLPEYALAFNDMKNQRIGVRYEAECAPAINSGMFSAFIESGNILGTFVGHDHVNDYLVNYHGIALTYGCFSGSSNTYQRTKNGSRIIVLHEGQQKFDTYIRENDGTILYPTSFPMK